MTLEKGKEKMSPQGGLSEALDYNAEMLVSVAHSLRDYFLARGKSTLRILDIGMGTGQFIIPLTEFLQQEDLINCQLECFDVDPLMVEGFRKNLAKSKLSPRDVEYREMDAEEGLLDTYDIRAYDLIVLTFVLDEIDDLENLLDDVADCLKERGLVIQAEALADLRPLDNKAEPGSPANYERFWKKYFSERAKYSYWPPEISISDYSLVYDYLQKKNGFKLVREETFFWKRTVRWGELCEWIERSPVASLRHGLSLLTREYLSRVMLSWLEVNRLREKSSLTLKWGYKITWMSSS